MLKRAEPEPRRLRPITAELVTRCDCRRRLAVPQPPVYIQIPLLTGPVSWPPPDTPMIDAIEIRVFRLETLDYRSCPEALYREIRKIHQ